MTIERVLPPKTKTSCSEQLTRILDWCRLRPKIRKSRLPKWSPPWRQRGIMETIKSLWTQISQLRLKLCCHRLIEPALVLYRPCRRKFQIPKVSSNNSQQEVLKRPPKTMCNLTRNFNFIKHSWTLVHLTRCKQLLGLLHKSLTHEGTWTFKHLDQLRNRPKSCNKLMVFIPKVSLN